MKKKYLSKIISLTIATTMVASLAIPYMGMENDSVIKVKADDSYTGNYDYINVPTANKGTSENPYRILEIVPSEFMGKMANYVSGEEFFDASTTNFDESQIQTLTAAGIVGTDSKAPFKQTETTKTVIESGYYHKVLSSDQTEDWYSTATRYEKGSVTDYEPVAGGTGNCNPTTISNFIADADGYYDVKFIHDTVSEVDKYEVVTATKVTEGTGKYVRKNSYVSAPTDDSATNVVFEYNPSAIDENKYSFYLEKDDNDEYVTDSNGHYVYENDVFSYVSYINDGDKTYTPVFYLDNENGEYVVYDKSNRTNPNKYNHGDNYKYVIETVYEYNDTEGDYSIEFVMDENGTYAISSFEYNFESGEYKAGVLEGFEDSTSGNFNEITVNSYTENASGEYVWLAQADDSLKSDIESIEADEWRDNEIFNVKVYRLKNNNLFRDKVLGKEEGYKIEVTTITPADLNAQVYYYDRDDMENSGKLNLINSADFIYISDYCDDAYKLLYQAGGGSVLSTDPTVYVQGTDDTNFTDDLDLTWLSLRNIVEVAAIEKTPVVIDYTLTGYKAIMDSSKQSTRAYHLPIMCAMYGVAEFYNYFINNFDGTVSETTIDYETGTYNGSTSWKPSLFFPSSEELQNLYGIRIGKMTPENTSNAFVYTNSVIENVYFNVEGTKILENNFTNEVYSTIDEDAFEGVTGEKSAANLFKHIIAYGDTHKKIDKDEFNMLVVQPCNDFTLSENFMLDGYYTEAFTNGNANFKSTENTNFDKENYAKEYMKIYIRRLIPDYFGPINITEQISSEFNGVLSDYVADYDMMYFGLNIGMFNQSSGKTIFNDSRMDGLIYMHVGDRYVGGTKLSGTLATDYKYNSSKKWYTALDNESEYSGHRSSNGFSVTDQFSSANAMSMESYRTSGNDISTHTLNKLKEYVDAGYAILAESALATTDKTYIDDSSNIYKLFNEKGSKDNVINISSVTGTDTDEAKKLSAALSSGKVNIELTDKPDDYVKAADGTVTYNNNGYVDSITGKNTVRYKFTINDIDAPANTKYSAYLYVDNNANGYYEDDEAIKKMTDLKAEVEYEMYKTLNASYTGILPWKLVIRRQGDDKFRDYAQGYTCIKNATATKTVIRILQIDTDVSNSSSEAYNPGVYPSKSSMSLEAQYYAESSTFKTYASNLDDFELVIDTINNSAFVKLFAEDLKNTGKTFSYSDINTHAYDKMCNSNYVDSNRYIVNNSVIDTNNGTAMKTYNYDMVIMGFADCYTDFYTAYLPGYSNDIVAQAKKAAVENLQYFIDSGRGVMFSHDTTSFVNYDFTGTGSSAVGSGNNIWDYQFPSGWNPYKSIYWGYSINKYLRGRLGTDRFDVAGDNLPGHNYDTATMPSQVKNNSSLTTYSEIQGYGYCGLRGNFESGTNTNNSFNSWMKGKFSSATLSNITVAQIKKYYNKYGAFNGNTDIMNSGNTTTTKVTKVNEGQITNYPYKLADNMTVSQTHGPYYQLNMEEDNMVVWYTLAYDSNQSSNSICYSLAPKDVTNYYYIYSFGNIMYTGSGHVSFTSQADEIKLFVNTMIAAYVPEAEKGTITIENSAGEANGQSVVYTYDIQETETAEVANDYVEVEFSTTDSNISTSDVTLKILDGDGNSISGVEVLNSLKSIIAGSSQYTIQKDEIYTARIPSSLLDGKDSAIIQLQVIPDDTSGMISTNVKLARRTVFELN